MDKLLLLVEELELMVLQRDKLNINVSVVNVGWHIEHTLMATVLIIDELLKSDPAKYKWRFNLNRLFVFSINKIPRGSAKAPKIVQPSENMSKERLMKYIEIAKEKISKTKDLNANNHFKHPDLGILNYAHAMKFMRIHARHHLKIIEEIIKN
ncbi:MAG: hypothetical protein QM737_13105 [Ferruginibacter sp.]